ncbi:MULTISPECIES: hypothetical protein [unclassified Aeromicrobium]|uniref:hypothetical protein n=1 Tax=unclassified Aeromicrobium TaxID=2633570 RepID=UPI00396B3473
MEWWHYGVTYLATFVVGGGLGGVLVYVFAPKADRERLRLDREKFQAERTEHVRQRRLKDLENLYDCLRKVSQAGYTLNANPDNSELDMQQRLNVRELVRAVIEVAGSDYVSPERSVLLMKTTDAVLLGEGDYLVEVEKAVLTVRRLLDEV